MGEHRMLETGRRTAEEDVLSVFRVFSVDSF